MSRGSKVSFAAVVLLVATMASASATVSTETTDTVVLDAGGSASFDPAPGATICNTAVLAGISAYTPVNDGSLSGNLDAFDGGAMIGVKERPFGDPDGKGTYDDFDTTYGETFKPGQQKLGGLLVNRTDSALGVGPVLRSLVGVRNPTARRMVATLTYQSNLGSDGMTVVRSSPGGLVNDFEEVDGWVVTADNNNDLSLDDPVVLTAVGDPAARKPIEVGSPVGTGCLTAYWKFRIPAGQTRYFVFFNEMHASGPAAQTSATAHYGPLDKSYLVDIPKSVRDRLINWRV